MNDLLVNVGDKRSQLMTEMTGTCKFNLFIIDIDLILTT